MSSSEGLADLIQDVQVSNIGNYLDLATFTVVVYDWVLTFPDEVRIMWSRPLTGSKVLFLLNRYTFVAFYVTIIMNDHVSVSNSSCSGLGISTDLFGVLHNLVVSVFQILRVYAISGRSMRYALLISAILVLPNCFTIYQWATSVFFALTSPFQGCSEFLSMSENTFNKLTIAQRVCLIVADAIVVIVTVHQTYGTVKASREANIQSSFSSTVLNAGILYFSVMFAMNTIDFIVQLTTNDGYFSDFPLLFDYLMISHFLLNLQDISTVAANGSYPSRPSFVRATGDQMSSIRFADMVIGNLGESLRDGSSHDDTDDADDDNDADDDGMTKIDDIEMGQLPHKDDEEPMRATFKLMNSEDIENAAGPSRLPLDVLPNRNSTSTGGQTESEMHT